jgi:uncharacterized protein YlaN (UPF0358 family)
MKQNFKTLIIKDMKMIKTIIKIKIDNLTLISLRNNKNSFIRI